MIIHQCQQGTLDWLNLRLGIPTASEMSNLVTPEFVIRKGKMPETYLAQKLAEKWLGRPLADVSSFHMEQGSILEEEAIPSYEFDTGETVTRVGFCTTDNGRVGCSPDGLLGEDGGLESKSPSPQKHVAYLLANCVPDDYLAQVHGSLYVSGRPYWKFMSYCRGLPTLILTVKRDEAIIEILRKALCDFNTKFDRAYQRLIELNGGEPKREIPKLSDSTMTLDGSSPPR